MASFIDAIEWSLSYMHSWQRFNETSLPDVIEFYSKLNTGDITDENYKHAIDFLENKDVPTFYKPIGKTRALNDSFNRFYIISALRVS